MRELKFRAWDGEKVEPLDGYASFDDGEINVDWGPKAIMQYTGIKDKNGKGQHELCQDDLVMCSGLGVGRVDKNYWGEWCVFFSKGRENPRDFNETMHDLIMEGDLLQYVGNIYENPEMLDNNTGG